MTACQVNAILIKNREMIKNKLIIEFIQDLTDNQKITLIYYCLGLNMTEIAKVRRVTKQAISIHMQEIERKKQHDEFIKTIQEAICQRGLFFD